MTNSAWRRRAAITLVGFVLATAGLFASPVHALQIVFKNGTDIDVPEVGISITDYQGTYDVGLFGSASISNFGGGGMMQANSGNATSMIRFDVSALAGKFSTINSVTLRLYPRVGGVSNGNTLVHRVSDLNSNWIEGDSFGGIVCCPGNAQGANWHSSVGNTNSGIFTNPSNVWAGNVAGGTFPGVDFDTSGNDGAIGGLAGLGHAANSGAVQNAVDGNGDPIGTPTPFDISLHAQPTAGPLGGGVTPDLTSLITDWASVDDSAWFERTGINSTWYSENMPWLLTCANGGFEAGCTPVVANEGLFIRGTTADTMEFWTGDGSNWGAGNDATFGVGGVTPVVYRPELIVDFEPAVSSCNIGDVNCDGFVEIGNDILVAFTNFTGPGSFGKDRSTGDVHGPSVATTDPLGHDGDVDVSDILTIFGAFTGPPPDEGAGGLGGPAEAGDPSIPDLIYDAATGEVTLDADGSSIIGYSLQNATNSFLPAGHTPILAGVTTALTSQLEEAALTPGSGSIGLVFPTGLDLAGLQALLTVNQVSRSLGAPLVPFDLVVVSTSAPVVPEPATAVLSLFTFAALGLLRWRLRRQT